MPDALCHEKEVFLSEVSPNKLRDSSGLSAVRRKYPWGLLLDFSRFGNSAPYIVSGFAASEDMFTWTDGKNVEIELNVDVPDVDISLAVRCFPFTSESGLASQEIHVYVNYHRLGFAELPSSDFSMQDLTFDIPRELIPSGRLNIQFFLPLAASPSELGSGNDLRRLGLAIESLCLAPRLAFT